MIVIARLPLARKLRAPSGNSVGAFSASGMSTIRRSRTAVLVMYSRVRGIGNLRLIASASAGSDAPTAADFNLSPVGQRDRGARKQLPRTLHDGIERRFISREFKVAAGVLAAAKGTKDLRATSAG